MSKFVPFRVQPLSRRDLVCRNANRKTQKLSPLIKMVENLPCVFSHLKNNVYAFFIHILRWKHFSCDFIRSSHNNASAFFQITGIPIYHLFLHKNTCCGTHKKCLIGAILMSTHNICFCEKMRKKTLFLLKTPAYRRLWLRNIVSEGLFACLVLSSSL